MIQATLRCQKPGVTDERSAGSDPTKSRAESRGELLIMDFTGALVQAQHITEVTRKNIIDALLLRDEPYHGRMDAVSFLGRIWDLTKMRATDRREPNLEADLRRHISWGDYDDTEVLYGKLNIGRCPDDQFGKFLSESIHPLVRPDAAQVAELLSFFNKHLAADGFVLSEASWISGHSVYEMTQIGAPLTVKPQQYDVSLSFAGEQRWYVDDVAKVLSSAQVRFFYAPYEEAKLWGEDLTEAFEAVFLRGSRFVVMFSSVDYAAKMWPTFERRAAVERAMSQNEAYILPVRFDGTQIPGVRNTIGYQDAQTKSPEEIARLILQKLGRSAY